MWVKQMCKSYMYLHHSTPTAWLPLFPFPVPPAFGYSCILIVNDFLRLDCHVDDMRRIAYRKPRVCRPVSAQSRYPEPAMSRERGQSLADG